MPFSEESIQFLFENRLQDSKLWFEEHRPRYQETVLEPLRQLVRELTPWMLQIDPQLNCEPKVGKCISRIYRDTRFSKDKSVFRDVMWVSFFRRKKLYYGMPGFFFEFSPRRLRWGCGYYQASPETMAAARELMLENSPAFLAARKAAEADPAYQQEGERYKRSCYPDQPEALRRWLDLKNLCLLTEQEDLSLLFREDLAPVLGQKFMQLRPYYAFLLQAEGRRVHRAGESDA